MNYFIFYSRPWLKQCSLEKLKEPYVIGYSKSKSKVDEIVKKYPKQIFGIEEVSKETVILRMRWAWNIDGELINYGELK